MKKSLYVELALERHRLEFMVKYFGISHPNVLTQSKYLDKLIDEINDLRSDRLSEKKTGKNLLF